MFLLVLVDSLVEIIETFNYNNNAIMKNVNLIKIKNKETNNK